jgi:methionine synthase reductase
VYASQLGNTEVIANILHKKIKMLYKDIEELNFINDIKSLEKYDYTIFLISTTGDGEFPDNGKKFWKILRKYRKDLLIKYFLIGFGDSNYNSFCHSAKCLDRRLKLLKSEEVMPMVLIDDATYDVDNTKIWIEDVSQKLFIIENQIQYQYTKKMSN